MGFDLSDTNDRELLALVRQLLEENSLLPAEAEVARAAIDKSMDGLGARDRQRLLDEVLRPFLSDCEHCGKTPDFKQLLIVYDTGLCDACFAEHGHEDTLGVRPGWMPMPPPANDEPEAEVPNDTPEVMPEPVALTPV